MKTKITKILQRSRKASMAGAIGAAVDSIEKAEELMKSVTSEKDLDALGFKLRRAKAFVMTALGEPGKGYDTYMS